MTSRQNNKNELILVAIDVAKHSHEVLILWPDGHQKGYRVANSFEDFAKLTALLKSQGVPVRAALEPTADYHRCIANWLLQHGVDVHMVSSLACSRVREALFNSWDKNDRKDAKVILYLLEQGVSEPFHDPLLQGFMHLQEISNTYHQIGLARTRCQHSLLNHYLPLFFPEFEKYFHSSRTEWFCRFLEKFPTPLCITSISKEDFLTQAWNLVGRKVAKERFLEEVYELAQKSVGLPIMENCPELYGFRIQLQRHLQLTAQRNDLEKLSIGILANNPDYHRLQTIPGIGPILALIILAESGDLRRFAHHRQYLSFCGFNLSGSQSGQSKSRYRISKRGNARLRYAFWLAATVAIRQRENSFRRKYETYIAQDRNNADLKRKAYCAIAIKVARVAHSLIKNAMDYRGYHDIEIPGGRTCSMGRWTLSGQIP